MQSVLSQIDELDGSLERAVEAYNLATDKLHAIEGDLQVNLRELHIAKANLGRSQNALSKRLVSIYTSGNEATSTLGILLGAGSIDDMLSQIETATASRTRICGSTADHRVPASVKKHRIELRNAEADAQALVQERSDQKASIQSQLSERHQLVASIRSDIERMKQEEAQPPSRARAPGAGARRRSGNAPAPIVSTASTAAPPATTPSPVAASFERRRERTRSSIAMRYLGIPYVYGGESPSAASTAPASRCTSTRRSASRSRTTRPCSSAMGTPVSMTRSSPATSSSSTASATSGCTSAAATSSTRRTPATWSRSQPLAGIYASVFDGAPALAS